MVAIGVPAPSATSTPQHKETQVATFSAASSTTTTTRPSYAYIETDLTSDYPLDDGTHAALHRELHEENRK
jgi:hypothetical protein